MRQARPDFLCDLNRFRLSAYPLIPLFISSFCLKRLEPEAFLLSLYGLLANSFSGFRSASFGLSSLALEFLDVAEEEAQRVMRVAA